MLCINVDELAYGGMGQAHVMNGIIHPSGNLQNLRLFRLFYKLYSSATVIERAFAVSLPETAGFEIIIVNGVTDEAVC